MKTQIPELSIFFPFWNEEKNIESVVSQAITIAEKVAKKWEIIMIDDGSTDKTLEKANLLAKSDKRLKVISHHPNRGYGSSLKEGFMNAKYEYVVFTDGDGQFDFNEIDKFIEIIDDADMVIGYRQKRKDDDIRLLLMKMLKVWDYILFGFSFRDIDCGFKLFKRAALEKIMPLRSEGAMITTEILAKATKKQLVIKEVSVTHLPRKHGSSTGANIPVIVRAVLESLILWWDIQNGRF
jgi:glycosyltransferase involved in cell wall biosynthesis